MNSREMERMRSSPSKPVEDFSRNGGNKQDMKDIYSGWWRDP
jgi:hypothetical protein